MSSPALPIAKVNQVAPKIEKVMLSVLAQVKAGDFTARMPLD